MTIVPPWAMRRILQTYSLSLWATCERATLKFCLPRPLIFNKPTSARWDVKLPAINTRPLAERNFSDLPEFDCSTSRLWILMAIMNATPGVFNGPVGRARWVIQSKTGKRMSNGLEEFCTEGGEERVMEEGGVSALHFPQGKAKKKCWEKKTHWNEESRWPRSTAGRLLTCMQTLYLGWPPFFFKLVLRIIEILSRQVHLGGGLCGHKDPKLGFIW